MITLNIDNGAPKQDLYLLLQSNEIPQYTCSGSTRSDREKIPVIILTFEEETLM